MRIIITPNGCIDFESPPYFDLKRDHINKFKKLLESVFGEVKYEQVKEIGIKYNKEPSEKKPWTREDYLLLLGSFSNSEVMRKTGRTEMSITMKRGAFFSAYFAWLKKKGLLARKDDREVQKQFLDETRGKLWE